MAVLMIVEVPGGTIDMYDQLNQEMGVGADNLPEGCLSHTAAFSDEGVIVADVWESAEAFQRFAEQQLGPAAQKTGLPAMEPRVHPVHNRLDGKGTTADTLVVIEVPGMTTADYDTMAAAMPSHQNNDHAAVSHTVARTDDGIIVVDIWGSPGEFQAFAEREIAPAAGPNAPPIEPRMARVHAHGRAAASVG